MKYSNLEVAVLEAVYMKTVGEMEDLGVDLGVVSTWDDLEVDLEVVSTWDDLEVDLEVVSRCQDVLVEGLEVGRIPVKASCNETDY